MSEARTVRHGLDRNGLNVTGSTMPPPSGPPQISVCLLAVPEVSAGVLNNFFEVFSFVGYGWELLTGNPGSQRRMVPSVVARARTPFRNSVGLPVAPDLSLAEARRANVVIVPDLSLPWDADIGGRWPAEVAWLKEQRASGALICSVCTGSLMLAEAGLLDGIEATSHWAVADQFRRCYPNVSLRPERLLVTSGVGHQIVTTGGPASWHELAVYLIARFCGEDEARRVAKVFIFGDKADGQLPFAARVRPPQHDDAAVTAAQDWIALNYTTENPVENMTRVSGLSSRTFKRRFAAATGYAPLDYVQSLRIEEAKQMLETSDLSIDAIAAEVGYSEPAAFRRLFKRATSIAPLQYRQRFRRIAES
jgi:transcriptional regulator GlxA family with amidase domain